MVSAPNDGNPNGTHWWYFQVGFKDLSNDGTVRWAQWTKSCYPSSCGNNPTHGNWYGSSVSGQHVYAVYLVASTQRLRATIDGTAIPDGPNYDPSQYWDAHWSANYSGETGDCASDIPGVATDKVHFDHVKRYNADGSLSFVSQFADQGVASSCTSFNYQAFSPGSGGIGFKIWTD